MNGINLKIFFYKIFLGLLYISPVILILSLCNTFAPFLHQKTISEATTTITEERLYLNVIYSAIMLFLSYVGVKMTKYLD